MSIRALLMAGIIAVAGGLAGAADAADKPVIAVLPKTVIGDVFMNNLANFAKAKGESLGATVEIYGASSHTAVEEQVSLLEDELEPLELELLKQRGRDRQMSPMHRVERASIKCKFFH